MKQYQGFEAKKSAAGREILPAGNYIAKILKAEEQATADNRMYIVLSFDIIEGDFKDFFRKDYNSQDPAYGVAKWRGGFRLWEPTGDGSEKDGWTKRTFNNLIACVEESNPGYHWDWNEQGLKGKMIGVMFRDKEWEFDGKTGWTTECGALCSIEDIRSGKAKTLKSKPLPQSAAPAAAAGFAQVDDDEMLPF
jgi:hypothetical protein